MNFWSPSWPIGSVNPVTSGYCTRSAGTDVLPRRSIRSVMVRVPRWLYYVIQGRQFLEATSHTAGTPMGVILRIPVRFSFGCSIMDHTIQWCAQSAKQPPLGTVIVVTVQRLVVDMILKHSLEPLKSHMETTLL